MRIIIDGETRDIPALWFAGDRIRFIDQRKLPYSIEFFDALTVEEAAYAIKDMVVRGAPAIGAAGAYGMALAAITGEDLDEAHRQLGATRPTAHDLFFAIDRLRASILEGQDPIKTSEAYAMDVIERCRMIGENGAHLIPEGGKVLTHCNAGALATGGDGTALAVLFALAAQGKQPHVFADETRPLLQGARLTMWELVGRSIDATLVCDSMAAQIMREGRVQAVITGADCIAACGDAANKIGTYGLAVLARAHDLPFYIAAPTSTFDLTLDSGAEIPIEQRPAAEITGGFGRPTAPEEAQVYNPAFDVTPAELITAIITERGVIQPVTRASVRRLASGV